MEELFEKIYEILDSGKNLIMASITATSGSVPRGIGAHMLVDNRGITFGSIGGGAVEYKAIEMAKDLLKDQRSGKKYFRLTKNHIEDIGMVCGGDVDVFFTFVESNKYNIDLMQNALRICEENEPSWLIVNLKDTDEQPLNIYGEKTGFLGEKISDIDLSHKPHTQNIGGKTYFIEKIVQAGAVYIFGGGHVSQALVPVLDFVGFKCIVLEDRAEFCKPELFSYKADTNLINYENIEKYIEIAKDDYVCIMTRGHKSDTIVQYQVLNTPAHYIGVIGSAKKISSVNAKLRQMGISNDQLLRVNSPIGIDIKAETPAEIAISIAAQLIEKRASK